MAKIGEIFISTKKNAKKACTLVDNMKNNIFRAFFGLLFLIPQAYLVKISGQDRFPANNILYDNSTIARVDILIQPDSFNFIMQDGNE